MLDAISSVVSFLVGYGLPVVVAIIMGGGALYLFCLAFDSDGLTRVELIGFGLVLASLTKWSIQWYFEFKSLGGDEPCAEADAILSAALTAGVFFLINTLRAAGLPYFVIGPVLALVAVFGA